MSEVNEFDDMLDDQEVVETEVEIVEEAVEVEAEAEKEPTTDSEKEPWQLTAVLDEREKRQAAVKEAEYLREKLRSFETPEPDVSVFEDEKGFVDNHKRETAEAIQNAILNTSEGYAEDVFGEEKVAAAKVWAQTEGFKSQFVQNEFYNSKKPYHKLVALYEDDLVRRDPEGYKAKLREEILAELKNEKPKSITPSLASQRSSGNSKTSTEDFEDILGA